MPQTNHEKSKLIRHLVFAIITLVAVIAVGEWLGPQVLKLESWIAAQGPKGPFVFLIIFTITTTTTTIIITITTTMAAAAAGGGRTLQWAE